MKRIGVAFPGDPSLRATWSGTPYGVMSGLEEAGAEAVPVCVEHPAPLRLLSTNLIAAAYLRPGPDPMAALRAARAAARASAAFATVTTWAGPRALRHAGRLDGVIQIGTGYTLNADVPLVTFEDMTVLQTKTHPYAGWDLLSKRAFDSRVSRQRQAYERAIGCCLTSEWAAESVRRDYDVPAAKVHVVGVGRNHVAPAVSRDWARPRFLFVGMDWERKNGDGVVRAFVRLRDELPDARLDVVGSHPPLQTQGVTGHGVLRLDVPEQHRRLERLFAESTCFVMPSHSEASAIAYVEAAAAGLPCIGTRNGGSDYLIGGGGLIVDPGDDDSLLDAMRQLAEPEAAAKMGAAAKQRSELFTWPAVARRLLDALEGKPAAGTEVASAPTSDSASSPAVAASGR